MATSLLDASAILAALYDEPGCDRVHETLRAGAAMSTVNVAEVAAHLRAHDWRSDQVKDVFEDLGIDVLPFDRATALLSGAYRPRTHHLGLGLGDRACLATARRQRLPVLTTDRAWGRVKLRGVNVVLIR
ncbi:MAG: type II toxin-antitoxin system VapC family toxin [Gemmatimonadota bacterium]|nr:type II toxin-antitoxin system VapC family toxin [Gemmatimonadota bacterium]MDE2865005.1 type II toxin-antitoxin system VapC family toxin [Gemmatimonadota bacterium]